MPIRADLFAESFGPNDPDLLNIDAVIRFIRRSWRLCLTWILVALCAGIAFATLSRTYYTAYATILLEDRTSRPLGGDPVGQAVAPDSTYVDSQVQLLQSDEVVGRVVDQNGLVESEEFGKARGGLFAPIIDSLGPGGAIRPTPRQATNTLVKRALSIRRVGLTNVVEIGFTSQNQANAAVIANAIAQNYIEGQRELNLMARADAKAFAITQQAQDYSLITPETGEQARTRLREQQNRAQAYRSLYKSFLQQGSTAQQQFSSGARVITPAQPPTERSWPRVVLLLAIAAMAGAAGGIAHALLRNATDHRLMTPEDVQRSTDIERITTVPKMSWETVGKSCQDGLQPAYVRFSATLYGAMGKVAVGLLGRQRQRSGVTIGVVAPTGGAGASSIAAHLAKVMAESGQKTLLIDANWRKLLVAPAVLNSEPALKQIFYTWAGVLTNDEFSRWCTLPARRIIDALRAKIPALKVSGFSRGTDKKHSQHLDDVSAGAVGVDWTTDLAPARIHVEAQMPALARALSTIHLEPERFDVLVLRATSQISELNAALSIIKTIQSQDNYDCVIVDFHSADQTSDLEASVRWGGVMAVIKKVIVVAEAGRTPSKLLHGLMRLVPRNKIAALVLNKV
jgi:capsular polysaccharide biosynthesis protein